MSPKSRSRLRRPLPPFKSVTLQGRHPGPRLVVTGGVHGNETCGTAGILAVLDEIDRGALVIDAGTVTFVPVANPLARALGRRCGDRNLNRALSPVEAPREFEDEVANWLCPLLAAHDVLLDLHSFSGADGAPFVLVGPTDNDGPLEPFAHAMHEESLARRLGVDRVVHGWLRTYADGVARRRAHAQSLTLARAQAAGRTTASSSAGANGDAASLDLDWRFGIGTTEYMRQCGGWALTLECGAHEDPRAPAVAASAIRRTLAHLGLVDAPPPAPAPRIEGLRLVEAVDRWHRADRWTRDWRPFDPVAAGEVIAVRRDGSALRAAHAGRIVFPNPYATIGEEWYYLAEDSDRFAA